MFPAILARIDIAFDFSLLILARELSAADPLTLIRALEVNCALWAAIFIRARVVIFLVTAVVFIRARMVVVFAKVFFILAFDDSVFVKPACLILPRLVVFLVTAAILIRPLAWRSLLVPNCFILPRILRSLVLPLLIFPRIEINPDCVLRTRPLVEIFTSFVFLILAFNDKTEAVTVCFILALEVSVLVKFACFTRPRIVVVFPEVALILARA